MCVSDVDGRKIKIFPQIQQHAGRKCNFLRDWSEGHCFHFARNGDGRAGCPSSLLFEAFCHSLRSFRSLPIAYTAGMLWPDEDDTLHEIGGGKPPTGAMMEHSAADPAPSVLLVVAIGEIHWRDDAQEKMK